MRTPTFIAALLLSTAAASIAAVPALAQDDLNVRTVRVADLDLASAAGQAQLDARIARAIEGVCGSYATTAEPTGQDRITACRKTTAASIARALAARSTRDTLALRSVGSHDRAGGLLAPQRHRPRLSLTPPLPKKSASFPVRSLAFARCQL